MENITLEQIDLLMQRANVSYSEAKEALEQCGGNTLEALLYLEKAEKIKTSATHHQGDGFKNFIDKLNSSRFILKKKEHTYIDVPLSVAIIAIITCFYVSILALIICLAIGIKVSIKGENDLAQKLNSSLGNFQK